MEGGERRSSFKGDFTWFSGGTEGGISCRQQSMKGDFRKLNSN